MLKSIRRAAQTGFTVTVRHCIRGALEKSRQQGYNLHNHEHRTAIENLILEALADRAELGIDFASTLAEGFNELAGSGTFGEGEDEEDEFETDPNSNPFFIDD